MLTHSSATVAAQYEALPYPPRDPADEDSRLIGTWLDDLDLLNHHCFRGERLFDAGFRVLVAGGGTGDGTIFIAQQLRERGIVGARIVHLDLSAAAIEIARARAIRRGLEGIEFIQGDLLDLPKMLLGEFDFINCVGVLHHLPDPEAGLSALLPSLARDGAMAVLLYGKIGRIGIYQTQEVLRRLPAAPTYGWRVRQSYTPTCIKAETPRCTTCCSILTIAPMTLKRSTNGLPIGGHCISTFLMCTGDDCHIHPLRGCKICPRWDRYIRCHNVSNTPSPNLWAGTLCCTRFSRPAAATSSLLTATLSTCPFFYERRIQPPGRAWHR
jgi:SAM-dependent methyltransferase